MYREDSFISETLAFWQERTSRKLTEEDAREIMETLHEFICILREWHCRGSRAHQRPSQEREVS